MSRTGRSRRKVGEDEGPKVIEKNVRLIMAAIPAMVWRKSRDGSADFFNEYFRQYTGLSSDALLGWGWMNAFHPEDRLMEEWRAALATGKPFEKAVRLRRADGEFRRFLVREVPLRNPRGKIVKWYGSGCDIESRTEAEDRLRRVLDATPALIHSAHRDGHLDYFNQGWLKYAGRPLADLQGWGWTTVIHPQDVDRIVRQWRACLVSGEPFQWEARLRRADGEYRWHLFREAPLRDSQGNIVNWYGSGVDVETRVQAEREARTLLEAIPQQIWSGPPNGTLEYCNGRWRSDTGLKLEDLQGNGWQRVLHPDDRDRVLRAWQHSVANKTPYEQDERHRIADGSYRWFLSRGIPLRDADEVIVGWYGTNTDIEDRKRAEETLRSSEREQRDRAAELERERVRLVEAQEVANVGSWEADVRSLRVIWSEQTHRIFETDPSRFRPTRPRFREFVHPEDRAKVDQAFTASLGNDSLCAVEYRIVMVDGRVKTLEDQWRTFHDGEGRPIRVAGTCRDITERVRVEQELRRLSGELLHSQDEERRKIARDLHDSTGQDLVALATMLGQMRTSITSPDRKSRRLLSECRALAHRCIREIRTLSYVLHPPALDHAGLGDAIRDYVTGFTRRSGIQVELKLSPQLGRMARDIELALFRVVQESLTNIHLHSGSRRAKIRIHRNSDLMLEISDLGRGVSLGPKGKEETRLDVGVGIPSMRERVKLIGGQLEIDSTRHGTTVRVRMPLERNEGEKAAHSGG